MFLHLLAQIELAQEQSVNKSTKDVKKIAEIIFLFIISPSI